MALAMILALIGGLLMMAWNLSMSLAMFRLGHPAPGSRERLAVSAG